MITLIKEVIHDFLWNPDFARARLRSIIMALGAVASYLVSSGTLSTYVSASWATPVLGIFAALATAIGQGEKNVRASS